MATPSVGDSFKQLVAALLGISTFSPPATDVPGPDLSTTLVRQGRESFGGNLEPIPQTRLRWYPPDIERAQRQADNGDMTLIGQLSQSMELDGVVRGLGDARAAIVDFPRRYYGSREVVDMLRSRNYSDRDVYEEMIPSAEAKLMVKDGIKCGLAVGEMVPVQGRDFPVLVRRFVQNLYYLWIRNQWYYRSTFGLLPIHIGYPRGDEPNWWVLHLPGGRLTPWNSGLWNTVGRAYINKTQTLFARQAYEFRHSQPARVLETTLGATNEENASDLRKLIRWAMNAAFVLPAGRTIKLVESNGQGIKVYQESIATYDKEIATAYCGSAAMLQGTVGFGNIDPFKSVSKDLRGSTANGWDHTVNTQILAALIGYKFGVDALGNATTVETDVSEPVDRTAEATTHVQLANAVKGLVEAIAMAQHALGTEKPIALDLGELLARFGVPTRPTTVGPDEQVAPPAGKQNPPMPSDPAEADAMARAYKTMAVLEPLIKLAQARGEIPKDGPDTAGGPTED
jgi:hypothetical protein